MKLRTLFIGLTILLGAAHPAYADNSHNPHDEDHFHIADAGSVDEAVITVTEALENQGFDIAAVINHSAAAASVGLSLPPTQVIIFRDTQTENRLIRRSETVALDLPLKILIWEDDDGGIMHKFNGPGYLIDRHGVRIRDRQLSKIEATLGQFGGQNTGVISVPASGSVDDTVASLTAILSNAGFNIPLTIDFTENKRRRLRDTTLIVFGNPAIGTQLMLSSREVALDLPQKFLVWQDHHQQTFISYNDPAFIAQRGGVQGLETLLGNITAALANLAGQGAAAE